MWSKRIRHDQTNVGIWLNMTHIWPVIDTNSILEASPNLLLQLRHVAWDHAAHFCAIAIAELKARVRNSSVSIDQKTNIAPCIAPLIHVISCRWVFSKDLTWGEDWVNLVLGRSFEEQCEGRRPVPQILCGNDSRTGCHLIQHLGNKTHTWFAAESTSSCYLLQYTNSSQAHRWRICPAHSRCHSSTWRTLQQHQALTPAGLWSKRTCNCTCVKHNSERGIHTCPKRAKKSWKSWKS